MQYAITHFFEKQLYVYKNIMILLLTNK